MLAGSPAQSGAGQTCGVGQGGPRTGGRHGRLVSIGDGLVDGLRGDDETEAEARDGCGACGEGDADGRAVQVHHDRHSAAHPRCLCQQPVADARARCRALACRLAHRHAAVGAELQRIKHQAQALWSAGAHHHAAPAPAPAPAPAKRGRGRDDGDVGEAFEDREFAVRGSEQQREQHVLPRVQQCVRSRHLLVRSEAPDLMDHLQTRRQQSPPPGELVRVDDVHVGRSHSEVRQDHGHIHAEGLLCLEVEPGLRHVDHCRRHQEGHAE
eukprot:2248530-Rhodomonas_salina.1